MANITAIYCVKDKKNRQDLKQYCDIVKLLHRQHSQGVEMNIHGLFEAKKSFRCELVNPYYSEGGFRVAKGDYFLLVDGKDFDLNLWRLTRACRAPKEKFWGLIGTPDNEKVFANDADEECSQSDLDETDYIKKVAVELPVYQKEEMKPGQSDKNYITMYTITETKETQIECCWGIQSFFESDFADTPQNLEMFRKLVQCNSAASIASLTEKQIIIDMILKKYGECCNSVTMASAHESIIIGIIDGKNNYWRCGIWGYRREQGKNLEIHEVDNFLADEYEYQEGVGLIPCFN